MEKQIKKVIYWSLMLCFWAGCNCFASENGFSDDYKQIVKYDVDFSTPEWYDMSMEERCKKCDFSEDLLAEVDTEKLLEWAINYPLGANLFLGDTFKEGFELMVSHSNVFQELLRREDLNDYIITAYRKVAKSFELQSDTARKLMIEGIIRNQWDELSFAVRMELVALHDSIHDDIWENYIEDIIEPYRPILNATSIFDFPLNFAERTVGFVTQGITIHDDDNTYYLVGRYYKYNTSCQCRQYLSGDLTEAQKQYINEQIALSHPNWIFSTGATKKYNCHSYIWISNDTYNNIYWLDDPYEFTNATSYFSAQSTNSALVCGQYAVICKVGAYGLVSREHSVKVNTSSTGSNVSAYMSSSYVQSKVGMAGLYVTTMADMFYNYSGSYYVPYDVL